ncbi:hypothetical protein [Hymenobacter sp.]|jgi:hypothetical protein|uniref:hypothetical protein n=1 Tax=Hymenobacter sp. TaxID=1898978 RepID=UPI002ED9B133
MHQEPAKSETSSNAKTSLPSQQERGLGGEARGEATGATNWRTWYWLVLGALAVEIVFFTYLTRLFA